MINPNRKVDRKKKQIQQPSTRDRKIIDRRAEALNAEGAEVLEYQFKLRSIVKRRRTRKQVSGEETAR